MELASFAWRREIDAFLAARTANQKLAILDFLDAVPREMRKYFTYCGWVMDPAYQRASVSYFVACDLFVKAEREYWKHREFATSTA